MIESRYVSFIQTRSNVEWKISSQNGYFKIAMCRNTVKIPVTNRKCLIWIAFNFFSPNDSPLKTMKNVFLFHLKSSVRSRDIQIFMCFFSSFPHIPGSKGQMEVE